jgi:hypothetical protein
VSWVSYWKLLRVARLARMREAAPAAAAAVAVVAERERAPDDVGVERGLAAVGVGRAPGRGEGAEGDRRAAGA